MKTPEQLDAEIRNNLLIRSFRTLAKASSNANIRRSARWSERKGDRILVDLIEAYDCKTAEDLLNAVAAHHEFLQG